MHYINDTDLYDDIEICVVLSEIIGYYLWLHYAFIMMHEIYGWFLNLGLRICWQIC